MDRSREDPTGLRLLDGEIVQGRIVRHVDVRPFEQAETELHPEDAGDGRIEQRVVDPAVGDTGRQRGAVRGGPRQLGVDTRGQGQPGSLPEVRREPMGRGEHLDADVVRGDDAVEPPLTTQDPGQQLGRGMARHAIDIAVGRHDAGDPGPADGRLEREELLVPELARADVGGGLVEPAFGQAVTDHVLAGRRHTVGQVRALERRDVGAAELRREVRVFPVGLLDPAPAWVARDVEHRCERLAGAGQQHPPTDRRCHRRDGIGVEARRSPDRLLETGCLRGQQPMEALLVDDGRDPEPGAVDEVALDRIRGRRHLDRSHVRGTCQAGDLADAVDGQRREAIRVEARLADDIECPERPELGDLLRAGHPRQEVDHARVDGQRGVPILRDRRSHQPFTAPPVSPPTMWRSAIM